MGGRCECAVYTSLSPGKRKRSSLEYTSRHLTIVGCILLSAKVWIWSTDRYEELYNIYLFGSKIATIHDYFEI